MGASELYALVDAKIDVLLTGWKSACRGADAAILEVANVLEDPRARAREARIMILRERAIIMLDMLYTFEAERYNSDVIARSNGFVVNAQIIYMSRGLSRLTSASALRTNRVSSLSNRRASHLITCPETR